MKRPLGLALNLDVDNINTDYVNNKRKKHDSIHDHIKSYFDNTMLNAYTIADKKHIGKLREYVDNIVSTLANVMDDDMHNRYTHIVKTYDVLNTRRRSFENGPTYTSTVYSNSQHIAKVYVYEPNDYADFLIVKEIAYQQYAARLVGICNFKTPMIHQFGKYESGGKTVFFIVMDKMKWANLASFIRKDKLGMRDALCARVSDKLNALNKCLQDNGLYHNDYHSENILLDIDDDIRVGLIDYGLSTSVPNSFDDKWVYNCDKLVRRNTRKSKSRSKSKSPNKTKSPNKSKSRTRSRTRSMRDASLR